MSTVDETVSKVDQGLQEMGIGSVKELKIFWILNSICRIRFRR